MGQERTFLVLVPDPKWCTIRFMLINLPFSDDEARALTRRQSSPHLPMNIAYLIFADFWHLCDPMNLERCGFARL